MKIKEDEIVCGLCREIIKEASSYKYIDEISSEKYKIDEKIKSINSSIKLLSGIENKDARQTLNENKKHLKYEREELCSLLYDIKEGY